MAWTDLKAAVAAVIRTNGNQEITGALLQSTLNSIIDQVGANASYKGVAIPSTAPGSPDGPVFYIASTQGTYANFGGFVLDGGFAVLSNVSGSWTGTKFLKTEIDAKAAHGYASNPKTLKQVDDNLAQLESNVNSVTSQINGDGTYGLDQSKRDVFEGKILAMWGDTMPDFPIFITVALNTTGQYGTLVQITKSNSNSVVAQYTRVNATQIKTGIEEILLKGFGNDDPSFYMIVNWDNINAQPITSSNRVEILQLPKYRLYNSIYARVSDLEDDVNSVTSQINGDGTYGLDQSKRDVFEGKILAMWGDTMPDFPIFITVALNTTGQYGTLVQITKSNPHSVVAQYTIVNATQIKTGIEEILLEGFGNDDPSFYMIVNWDNINAQPITSSNRVEILQLPKYRLYNSIYARVSDLEDDETLIDEKLSIFTKNNDITFPVVSDFGNELLSNIAWEDSVDRSTDIVYLRYIQNNITTGYVLIQFVRDYNDTRSVVSQYFISSNGYKEGIQRIKCNAFGSNGATFYIDVNFDLIDNSKESYAPPEMVSIDLSKVQNTPQNNVFGRINYIEKYIQSQEDFIAGASINVFGDVIPSSFKEKLWKYEKDIEVVCVGDSLTGLISGGGAFPVSIASQLPPGNTHNHWTYMLWDRICKNKPLCDRLDSVRDNVEIFTKTGVWSQIVDDKFNLPGNGGEWSYSSLTYQCQDLNAKVSFVLNSDTHKKASIVFSINPDGGEGIVQVTEGNGKLIASLDKINWVEANNFTVLERNNDGKTDQQCYDEGLAMHQRHRRIWLKVVNGTSGNLNISFSRNDSDTNKFLYCWGIERWNGNSLFLTNLGRGGRSTTLLRMNISDIFDRNVDLTIYEMPLANEISIDYNTLTTNDYFKYFLSDLPGISYKVRSNNYQDVPLLCVLPHGRGSYWSGNKAMDWTHTGVPNDYLPYFKMKMVLNYLKENGSAYNGLTFVNLQDQMIQEAYAKGMTIEESLTGSLGNKYCFTTDTVHLSNKGSQIWNKYLAPIFDAI